MGFLDWIVELLQSIYYFIENMVSSITTLLTTLVQVSHLPTTLFVLLPSVLGASMLAVVGIGVAKLLLGWGNT